ncbi:MAG: class I SAM-dependent methyltransferase [Gammaproteobacteria bacterium]
MIGLKPALTFLLLTISFQGYSQQQHHHGAANTNMNQNSFETLVANFEDESRDTWQKPEEVMALIGDIQGKTVMDIGSGTGYFSFRLAKAGAKVICADVDDRFLAYIEDKMKREDISDEQMELRKVPYHSSTLEPAEADMVLIVDTYHHIQERVDYFTEVRRGLKPGGKLVVIDFEKRELPVGPPVSIKLSEDAVVAELVRAGFSDFSINRDLLPYQYIIEAY